MNNNYLSEIADKGADIIDYIGLVDETGTEFSSGDYARKMVTWEQTEDGFIQPTEDLVFQIPSDTTVAGWRTYSDATAGVEYGGDDVDQETYNNAGEYKLIANETGIKHNAQE